MSELTREQVERLCDRLHKEVTWKHEIHYILSTDAALRAKLEAVTAERDEALLRRSEMIAMYEQLQHELRETTTHLEAQRTETYQAVEREQRAKRKMAEAMTIIERLVMTEEDARWVASRIDKQP
jgi:hypothetical protein